MDSKNHWFSKIFGNVSLRTLLVVLFVIQIFTAVGVIGYLSFHNGQKAVNDLAAQLQNEVSARIQQHLASYLEMPHLINQSHLNAIRLGLLNLQDPDQLGHYFWHQLQVFNSVSTIYFGNEQGGLIVARRQADETFTIEQTKDFTANDYLVYTTDVEGNRGNLLRTNPPFDSRKRPWYKMAVAKKHAIWSEVFSIYARQELAIAASLPVYGQQNQLQGVLTTQLVISHINEFLKKLKIGRGGKIFIIERSGDIVASSTTEKPFIVHPPEHSKTQVNKESSENTMTGEMQRLKASESSVPLIRFTAQHLTERFGQLENISNEQQFIFELDNQRQYLQVTPLQDSRGLDWLIVVAVPESDFMERINANTRATIILSLTALAIATLVGVMTSKWIIRPIFSLTIAAQRISKGHWDEKIPVARSDELGVLAESFNSMVMQLQESFATLEGKSQEINKLNERLEYRVSQRTAELNAKVEELMQTRNELLQSEKMASLGRLVAGFAHEINTPIGVAVGAASTLQETAQTIIKLFDQEEVDEEELVSALESVEEAAELTLSNLRRAIRLVGSFKRTAVDQSSEVSRFFDVRETIEDVNNSLHNKFKKTTIKIEINCPKGLTLYGLPGALDQILTNLMMNSFVHGFEEGQLEGYIFITARLKGDHLYLEYSDTGKGMTQETVEKVFEPFFTTRRGYGGSGLGMYICYNLVTSQLHGMISCESALGEGVTFRIEYPIQVS